jgi:hypothetical protein
MPFADRDVRCAGCGVMFVFSAGEQQFFQEKGLTNRNTASNARLRGRVALHRVELKHMSFAQGAGATQLSHSSRRKADLSRAESVSQTDPKFPILLLRNGSALSFDVH